MANVERWHMSSASTAANNCVQVSPQEDGVLVRNSKDPDQVTVKFTWAEWDAWLVGVRNGEFDFPDRTPAAA